MHKTKIGEFKYLTVILFIKEEEGTDHLFYDKDTEVSEWMYKEMRIFRSYVNEMRTLKDLNYLLNEMVKAKGKRIGKALYDIYINHYPDDDQKKKVIEFWNKEN